MLQERLGVRLRGLEKRKGSAVVLRGVGGFDFEMVLLKKATE